MASKNVYFFEVQLSYRDKEINHSEIKNVLGNIINEYATEFDEYKSLDATPYDDEMHLMMDIYEYDNNFFFARISKQKPSNSMVQHDYRTYEKEDAPHVEYGHRTVDGGWVPGQRFLKKNVDTQAFIYYQDLLNAIRKE